jgi:two-component system, OmpR family, phosphate regulon response regulator PhoB
MGTLAKILIVEWDTSCAELLWNEVRHAGHDPLAAFSVERAAMMVEQEHPQAILLRWKLPDASGLSLINDLRTHAATSRMPIIVLGEEGAGEDECVRALEAGADDYMKRPFSIRELIARVQVVLRPIEYREVRRRVSVETLTMDFDARRAFARTGGEEQQEVELQLGPTCYRLLRFFVENPYKVLSRKDIIDNVWFGSSVKDGIVDVYIKSLRETLEPLQKSLVIETVRGAGFRLASVVDMSRAQALQQAQAALDAPAGVPVNAPRGTPAQAPAGAPGPRPAPAPQSRKRPPVTNDQPRNGTGGTVGGALRNQPVLVSDLSAAVEKIRHLQVLLQRKTEENRLLRDAVEAGTGKPMSSGGLTTDRHKNKR